MLVFFSIWLLMLIFSVAIGARHSLVYRVSGIVNFCRKGYYNYTLGLHHTAHIGYNKATSEIYRVETVYVGMLLVTIEVDFFKVIGKGPEEVITDPPGVPMDFPSH